MVYGGGRVKAISIFLLALWWGSAASIRAQSRKKPKEPPLVHVIVEFIEVEHLDYSDWLLGNRLDSDANDLRVDVQKWITAGRGKIIETVVCTVKSGRRGKTRSGDEYVFPTEFDPPEVPNKVSLSGKASTPITPVGATAFETKNLGVTLEVDPVLGYDQVTIDLNLAPDIVKLKEKIQWPSPKGRSKSSVDMPIFHSMRITTQVTTFSGRYVLLGTTRPLKASDPKRNSPLILQFVRADVAKAKTDAVKE